MCVHVFMCTCGCLHVQLHMRIRLHMPRWICIFQTMAYKCQPLPSPLWVLRTEVKSSGLVGSKVPYLPGGLTGS